MTVFLFLSPAQRTFRSFYLSLGVFSLNLDGLSGCREKPAALGPPGFHMTPERERQKEQTWGAGEGSGKFWAPAWGRPGVSHYVEQMTIFKFFEKQLTEKNKQKTYKNMSNPNFDRSLKGGSQF